MIERAIHGVFLILGLLTVGCVLLITIYLVISGIPAITEIGLFDKDGKYQGLVSFAEEILAAQETEGIGWLVLPYAQDHSIEQVLRDAEANINANSAGVEDSSNLLSCTDLGIGVGVHGDGTYFWAIFYK